MTSNVSFIFQDTFKKVKQHPNVVEVCEELNTLVLSGGVGLFSKSDIIIMYDKAGNPRVITERLFKKDYKPSEFRKLRRSLINKCNVLGYEFDFRISVTVSKDYVDYTHCYRDYWTYLKEMRR